ncbi:MAG: hypothetical protein K2Q03_00110 [Sphingobacteriaceae bacterium]|nr:hypothetical protein [Sphingobacteriaceae bacterium]
MKNKFELEQNTHLVLAQYYRWYQVYEVPFTKKRIENQKDILTDDVEIVSQMGTSKGKEGLEDRLKVFEGWLNAHHVQNTKVTQLADKKLSLEADILYQNIRPDASKHSYTLHYSTILQTRNNDLPRFEKLELKPTGEVKEFNFESAYVENRAKSFMHYWLYLMETNQNELFKELLASTFKLNLSDGKQIENYLDFEKWKNAATAKIATSTHQYKNFNVQETEEDVFLVSVDFDWLGITIDGKEMTAETHHEWILKNDKDDRFAKMKEMTVTIINPFVIKH